MRRYLTSGLLGLLLAGASLPAAPAGQFEGVAHHSGDAAPRVDTRLHSQLVVLPAVQVPANMGIFSFGVLAHDYQVDVAWLGQW